MVIFAALAVVAPSCGSEDASVPGAPAVATAHETNVVHDTVDTTSSSSPQRPANTIGRKSQSTIDETVASTAPSTPESMLSPLPPKVQGNYNRLELQVIESLASLGIEADTGELSHGDGSATMLAEFDGGSVLQVNASTRENNIGDASVLSERSINGVVVQRLRYTNGSEVIESFACSGNRYDARGAVPPGFEDFETFLTSFIGALGCRPDMER